MNSYMSKNWAGMIRPAALKSIQKVLNRTTVSSQLSHLSAVMVLLLVTL